MTSWPVLPIGAVAYLAGMAAAYLNLNAAERCSRNAAKSAQSGQRALAVQQLTRAIALRPVTARYHLALAGLLGSNGEDDPSAREIYAGWDIDRGSLIELYRGMLCFADPGDNPVQAPIRLDIVLFLDGSEERLAEFLDAINAQRRKVERLDVLIVATSGNSKLSPAGQQLRKTYGDLARFVSPEEAWTALRSERVNTHTSRNSLVVVSSCSCLPPPDWLSILVAYVQTYPEVELFHGSCRPVPDQPARLLQSLGLVLGLFPHSASNGSAFHFARGVNWACRKSLLTAGTALNQDGPNVLDGATATDRLMKLGASSLYAQDWQILFRLDATLNALLRTAYRDGHDTGSRVLAAEDRALATQVPIGRGVGASIVAAWRFARTNYRTWRHPDRNALLHPLAFLLLLLAGTARQIGWLAGLRQSGATGSVGSK